MDARAAKSPVESKQISWLQRERASGRFYDRLIGLAALMFVGMAGLSAWLLRSFGRARDAPEAAAHRRPSHRHPVAGDCTDGALCSQDRCAEGRRGGLGSGRLHVRLVVLFTAIAAVPTVLVAIFASVLFQSGLEFWFSNSARNMLENTVQIAKISYQNEVERVANETVTASSDIAAVFAHDDNRRSAVFAGICEEPGAQQRTSRKRSSLLTAPTSRFARLRW